MIFCKLKKTATWLQKRMTEDGHAVAMLTSDISIEDRLSTLNRCGIYFGKIYNNCSPFLQPGPNNSLLLWVQSYQ